MAKSRPKIGHTYFYLRAGVVVEIGHLLHLIILRRGMNIRHRGPKRASRADSEPVLARDAVQKRVHARRAHRPHRRKPARHRHLRSVARMMSHRPNFAQNPLVISFFFRFLFFGSKIL